MAIHVNNKYRIKRNANQQEMMQKLMSGNKLFDSYRDILMISAAIGYANNAFVPIVKTASDGVLMQFFSEKDWDFMDLIAYAHKKEQDVLYSDEKYEIFSSYANGGFPILMSLLGIELDTDMDDTIQERKLLKLCELMVTGDILAPIEDEVFI